MAAVWLVLKAGTWYKVLLVLLLQSVTATQGLHGGPAPELPAEVGSVNDFELAHRKALQASGAGRSLHNFFNSGGPGAASPPSAAPAPVTDPSLVTNLVPLSMPTSTTAVALILAGLAGCAIVTAVFAAGCYSRRARTHEEPHAAAPAAVDKWEVDPNAKRPTLVLMPGDCGVVAVALPDTPARTPGDTCGACPADQASCGLGVMSASKPQSAGCYMASWFEVSTGILGGAALQALAPEGPNLLAPPKTQVAELGFVTVCPSGNSVSRMASSSTATPSTTSTDSPRSILADPLACG